MIAATLTSITYDTRVKVPTFGEMREELMRGGRVVYEYVDRSVLSGRGVERGEMSVMHGKMQAKVEEAVVYLAAFMAADALGLLSGFFNYTAFLFMAFHLVPMVYKVVGHYLAGRELGLGDFAFDMRSQGETLKWALLTSVPEFMVYGPMGVVSMATGYFLIDLVNEAVALGGLSLRDVEKIFIGALAAGFIRMELGPLFGASLLMRNVLPEVARMARKAALIYF